MPETGLVFDAAKDFSERDFAVLLGLLENKILSTGQILVLFFNSLRRTQATLQRLRDVGAICSYPSNSRAPARARDGDHHYLSDLGLRICAWHTGTKPSALPAVPRCLAEARAVSRHLRGVTRFGCEVVQACEDTVDYGLHAFARERTVEVPGRRVQPDATARLLTPAGAVEFFLEYDRATEAFGKLSEKFAAYLYLASLWEKCNDSPMPSVAFFVDFESRQAVLSRALIHAVSKMGALDFPSHMPFYVAAREGEWRTEGPLGAVWRDLGAPAATKLRFDQLPLREAQGYDLRECIGRRWRWWAEGGDPL